MVYSYYATTHHCINAEMTPELCDDLIKFSFHDLRDVLHSFPPPTFRVLSFVPPFLSGLRTLVCYFSPHEVFAYLYTLQAAVC